MCGPKVSFEVIDLSYLIDDENTPEDQLQMDEQLENGLASTPAHETVDATPATPTVDQEPAFNIHDYLFLVEAKRNFLIARELNRIARATANNQLLMADHERLMMEEERRMEQANNDLLDFFSILPIDYEINHTCTASRYMHHFTGSETSECSTLPTSIW